MKMTGQGHQPEETGFNLENPPQGGSGLPSRESDTQRSYTTYMTTDIVPYINGERLASVQGIYRLGREILIMDCIIFDGYRPASRLRALRNEVSLIYADANGNISRDEYEFNKVKVLSAAYVDTFVVNEYLVFYNVDDAGRWNYGDMGIVDALEGKFMDRIVDRMIGG
jgi:hypothetical protein